jgi:hypothetical protein
VLMLASSGDIWFELFLLNAIDHEAFLCPVSLQCGAVFLQKWHIGVSYGARASMSSN